MTQATLRLADFLQNVVELENLCETFIASFIIVFQVQIVLIDSQSLFREAFDVHNSYYDV